MTPVIHFISTERHTIILTAYKTKTAAALSAKRVMAPIKQTSFQAMG